MVLTHFEADISDQMPCFASRLYPLIPKIFLGRSAKAPPECAVADTVYTFFRDRLHSCFPVLLPPAHGSEW